jgi:hypothetical protein
MRHVSRRHYARKIEGSTLRVKAYSRRIEVQIPDGVKHILVERASLGQQESERIAWRASGDEALKWILQGLDDSISVLPGQKVEIASETVAAPILNQETKQTFKLAPMVRRQLTEIRDRVAPYSHRLKRLVGGKVLKSNGSSRA